MSGNSVLIKRNLFFSIFILAFNTSCALQDIHQQSEAINDHSTITGSVSVKEHTEGQPQRVIVFLFKYDHLNSEPISSRIIAPDQPYKFDVLPGDYLIEAYLDSNSDKIYQTGEPAGVAYTDADSPTNRIITVTANQKLELAPIKIAISLDNLDTNIKIASQSKTFRNIGRKVSLSQEMFSKEAASLGLWQPVDYLNRFGGGLFFLEEFSATKTPVIFIHGIDDTGRAFENLVAELDADRYQFWLLNYPSGIKLNLVSQYLYDALNSLHYQHSFPNIYLISHSMGGLVGRSFIKLQTEKGSPYSVDKFITINSPLLGLSSAKSGVENSPVVVSSWRDLSSSSDFIADLNDWNLPADIQYHLIFSYLPDQSGDGVIPLTQQLSLKLQREAESIIGFESEHSEILSDSLFIETVKNLTESSNDD